MPKPSIARGRLSLPSFKGVLSSSPSVLVANVFLASIVIGIIFHTTIASRTLVVYSDFVSFLTGAKMVKEGVREDFYDLATQYSYQKEIIKPYDRGGVLPFKNLSIFAIPFIPLTYLAFPTNYKIFAYFNLVLLVIIASLSVKIFNNIRKYKFWYLIPFVFLPSLLTVVLGQISIILSLVVLYIYKFIKSQRPFFAGMLSGLLLIKPQYLIAVPFIFVLTKGKRNYLFGFIFASLAIVLSSIYLSGAEALLSYPSFLLSSENASFANRAQRMFTFSSTLFYLPPIFNLGYKHALYINGGLYFLIYYLYTKRYQRIKVDNAYSSGVLFTLLFGVHVLEHDLSLLLIPILILLNNTELNLALILFILPLVILISPVAGTLTTFVMATLLLYEKKGTKWR